MVVNSYHPAEQQAAVKPAPVKTLTQSQESSKKLVYSLNTQSISNDDGEWLSTQRQLAGLSPFKSINEISPHISAGKHYSATNPRANCAAGLGPGGSPVPHDGGPFKPFDWRAPWNDGGNNLSLDNFIAVPGDAGYGLKDIHQQYDYEQHHLYRPSGLIGKASLNTPRFIGTVVLLMIFAICMLAVGVMVIEDPIGKTHSLGDIGLYLGIPLVLFGVIFILMTARAVTIFYFGVRRSPVWCFPELLRTSRLGNQLRAQEMIPKLAATSIGARTWKHLSVA